MKILTILIVLGVVGAGAYLIAREGGFITPSATYPTATQINLDTATLASMSEDEQIAGILNQIEIKIYGVNGKDMQSIMAWYDNIMLKDGWTLIQTWQDSGNGWGSMAKGWQKGVTGRAIIIWEGTKVKQRSGYDCVVVVATAPMWVWERILSMR